MGYAACLQQCLRFRRGRRPCYLQFASCVIPRASMSTVSRPRRGAFIVLEGLDRSGKSTQAGRLLQRLTLQGYRARLQKFPDRITAVGMIINAYLHSNAELDDRAIHLLFSANRWECSAAIERDLHAGIIVIADRYAFSGIAFTAAKGIPFDFCLNPDTGLPLPDLTLFVTIPPGIASARTAYGEERYETLDMQSRVRAQFDLVANEVKRRHGEDRWVSIDGSGTIADVESAIWESAREVIADPGSQLGRLWDPSPG